MLLYRVFRLYCHSFPANRRRIILCIYSCRQRIFISFDMLTNTIIGIPRGIFKRSLRSRCGRPRAVKSKSPLVYTHIPRLHVPTVVNFHRNRTKCERCRYYNNNVHDRYYNIIHNVPTIHMIRRVLTIIIFL